MTLIVGIDSTCVYHMMTTWSEWLRTILRKQTVTTKTVTHYADGRQTADAGRTADGRRTDSERTKQQQYALPKNEFGEHLKGMSISINKSTLWQAAHKLVP